MRRHADFLLLGGGLASATAAEALRAEGAGGTILLLSAEDSPPYHRPPLSTEFLLGTQSKEQLQILNADYCREQLIEVVLGARAALPGIYYLRTVHDAEAINSAAETAKRAVVVGGSFIGLELAASLTKRGIHVTLIAREGVLLEQLESPMISDFFRDYYDRQGVEIVFGDVVVAYRGNRHVEAVVTRSGVTLPCDMVALGIATGGTPARAAEGTPPATAIRTTPQRD